MTRPLRLQRFSIHNFRGIDSLEIDLRDGTGDPVDLAVFAGDNGVGKTSVLEALLLMLRKPDLLANDAPPLDLQVHFGAAESVFECSFEDGLELRFSTADFVRLPAPWSRGLESHNAIVNLRPEIEYFSARREPEDLGANPGPRGVRSQAESRRLIELQRSLVQTFVNEKLDGAAAGDESPFTRLNEMWRRFNGPGTSLHVLKESGRPDSKLAVVIREDSKPLPEDIKSLATARELAQTRADVPAMVPLDRCSSGQMALFAFAGPILFRERPLDFIFIDEPEQHLHPSWHRLILPALRALAPHAQFFVATHSQDLLRSVLSSERFILREPEP